MPSGVKIKDVVVGTGLAAERGKVAVIHYRVFLNRGEEVDSTHLLGRPAHIHLGKREAIAGLQLGIEGMREGGRRELEISPHLAYGEEGVRGKIPSHNR